MPAKKQFGLSVILAAALFIATSCYAASSHDIDMAWSKYNLSVITLHENLERIERTESTNQNTKEIIREFQDKVDIISERIYDCYIICELVILNDDKSEAFRRLASEFLDLKKDDINKNIEYLAIQSSLIFKKNIKISQMIDEYIKITLETSENISNCYTLQPLYVKPS